MYKKMGQTVTSSLRHGGLMVPTIMIIDRLLLRLLFETYLKEGPLYTRAQGRRLDKTFDEYSTILSLHDLRVSFLSKVIISLFHPFALCPLQIHGGGFCCAVPYKRETYSFGKRKLQKEKRFRIFVT